MSWGPSLPSPMWTGQGAGTGVRLTGWVGRPAAEATTGPVASDSPSLSAPFPYDRSESESGILEQRLQLGVRGHWICFLFLRFWRQSLVFKK